MAANSSSGRRSTGGTSARSGALRTSGAQGTASGGKRMPRQSSGTAPRGAGTRGGAPKNTAKNGGAYRDAASSQNNRRPAARQGSGASQMTPKPAKKRKKKLSPEEIEHLRRVERVRRRRAAERRKKHMRALMLRLAIGAATYIVTMAFILITAAMDIYSDAGIFNPSYTYTIGRTDEDSVYAVTWGGDFITREGVLYTNFTDIAEYLGMVVTGGSGKLRFVIPTDDVDRYSELAFVVGSDGAEINGTRVRMDGASFEYENELFLPLDFVEENVNGITITKNEKRHRIQIERTQKADEEGKLRDETITLSLKKDEASEHIDYRTVAAYIEEIQAKAEEEANSVIDASTDETADTPAGASDGASSGSLGTGNSLSTGR